ncbi:MAG: hypothetical protein M0Q95_00725 [Porticoccaceae bacterium]|jgi:hypothetical protein|nr:hypothetical protein [Porticoccaceae bacterium]
MFRNSLICFAAGTLGAMINSLVVWLFGQYGISQSLGVAMAPSLTTYWLYPRLVWGGLWGFLFLLSWFGSRTLLRGLVFSLFPTAVQLFYIFPYEAYQGMAGYKLGALTPLLVLFFNGIWGLATAIAIKVR